MMLACVCKHFERVLIVVIYKCTINLEAGASIAILVV